MSCSRELPASPSRSNQATSAAGGRHSSSPGQPGARPGCVRAGLGLLRSSHRSLPASPQPVLAALQPRGERGLQSCSGARGAQHSSQDTSDPPRGTQNPPEHPAGEFP